MDRTDERLVLRAVQRQRGRIPGLEHQAGVGPEIKPAPIIQEMRTLAALCRGASNAGGLLVHVDVDSAPIF